MPSQLAPYLSFKDNAREAMTFYQTVFGSKLELHTFKEYHMDQDPSEGEKIMHSMLTADNRIVFMGADTPKAMEYHEGSRISMALSGDNETELRGYFDKLSVGGQVIMPVEKAEWGDTFGMCVDQFGITWMVNISSQQEKS